MTLQRAGKYPYTLTSEREYWQSPPPDKMFIELPKRRLPSPTTIVALALLVAFAVLIILVGI